MMTAYAQKFTTKPRLHKMTWTWIFYTSFLLWDSGHAKIYKSDFRIRGLVVKLASQTSSRMRAIFTVSGFQGLRIFVCLIYYPDPMDHAFFKGQASSILISH